MTSTMSVVNNRKYYLAKRHTQLYTSQLPKPDTKPRLETKAKPMRTLMQILCIPEPDNPIDKVVEWISHGTMDPEKMSYRRMHPSISRELITKMIPSLSNMVEEYLMSSKSSRRPPIQFHLRDKTASET